MTNFLRTTTLVVIATAFLAVTFQSAITQTPRISTPGDGGTFGDIDVDGDRVQIRRVASRFPGRIHIKLNSDNEWWKMLRVIDRNGLSYSVEQMNGRYRTEAGNQRKMSSISIDSKDLGDTFKLEFWKAKFLGVTTYIRSETYRKQDFVGRVVTFNWREGLNETGQNGDPLAPINEALTIDEKRVTIRSSDNVAKGSVKLVFRTGLDWWTALKFIPRDGKARSITKVDGKYAPANNSLTIPISLLKPTTTLEFWTAKAFGVHTRMSSKSIARERLDGRTVVIDWPR